MQRERITMSFEPTDAAIAGDNGLRLAALDEDYDALARSLSRRGVDIEALTARAAAFRVAVPSWGVGTGGTRFGRFPGPGEPRNVFEKVDDCAVIQALTRVTPEISLHIPWDRPMTRPRSASRRPPAAWR
jgi:L-rhamnose isomerase/sugar isomerase